MEIEGECNLGAWFTNEEGISIATTTWNQRGYTNPLAAETKMIQNAVELAKKMEAQVITIFSDNKELVYKLRQGQGYRTRRRGKEITIKMERRNVRI